MIVPFPEATDCFGESKYQFMVNFRVASLAAMLSRLQAAGLTVEVDPVQLWQPKADELSLPQHAASSVQRLP